MSTRLVSRALENLREAEEHLRDAIEESFPAGTNIFWVMRGGQQTGTVVRPCGDRILVRNDRTGKEYFVHAYVLTSEYQGGKL